MERIYCNPVVLKEVAHDLGLNIDVVKNIVNTQSEYTKLVMESNTFDSVRWIYLGVFKSKPKEIQMINYLRGMTPEQQQEFKKKVRTGQIKFNHWEDELKQKKRDKRDRAKLQLQRPIGSNGDIPSNNTTSTIKE